LLPVTTGTVNFDADTLDGLNQATVNLSDSSSLVLQKTDLVNFGSSGYTWTGNVVGEADSIAVLTADNGEVTGTIHTNLRDWEVIVKDGIPDPVRQFQALSFPIDQASVALPPIFKDGFESLPSPGAQAMSAKGQLEPTIIGCTDEPSRVDILVAYTSNAGKKYPDIVNNIHQAINLSNSSFADSLISPDGQPLKFNLAGVMEVDWADWAGINWDSILETLSTDNSVDQERASASADIVILLTTNIAFTDNGNYASGQALLNGPLQIENASAALRVDRTKYYALAHEIGHLFGAAHDRYSITYPDAGQGAALPGSHYGFVHIDDENSFNTIMASALGCKNQLPTVRCIRKNLFSNPDRIINGVTPAGTVNDNNADQITSAAPTVACYYNRS